MKPGTLYRLATNCLDRSSFRAGGAPWGRETRPHLSDDEGVQGPTTRKEVSYGSVYHTTAPLPTPSPPQPAGTPARLGSGGVLLKATIE